MCECLLWFVLCVAATMTGLRPRTRYHYRVGGDATGWSRALEFRSQSTVDALPVRVGVLGDFGDTNGPPAWKSI